MSHLHMQTLCEFMLFKISVMSLFEDDLGIHSDMHRLLELELITLED